MNWLQQRLLAAAQFAKQQAQNLYNNAPITQAIKKRSFQPLVTAVGKNAMNYMGTAEAKNPFVNGSGYFRKSMMTPGQSNFNQGIEQRLAREAAQAAARERQMMNMRGFQKANSGFSPEQIIRNYLKR